MGASEKASRPSNQDQILMLEQEAVAYAPTRSSSRSSSARLGPADLLVKRPRQDPPLGSHAQEVV